VLADDARLKLSLSILNAQPPALQRRLLRQALRRRMGHLRRISVLHIEALREMLSPNPKHRAVCLPGGIRALRLDDTIQFETAGRPESLQIPPDKMSAVEVTPVLDKTIVVNLDRFCCSLKFTLKNHSTMLSLPHNAKNEAVFDAGLISLPLTIRSFRPGDRLQPFGMRGSKKVKDLFIDLKIPRSQRVTIPLLIGNDRILWVAGLRRSAGAPVTPATRRVLHVACTPAILC
jgi:tRNA(Ile)-lysidine synthase